MVQQLGSRQAPALDAVASTVLTGVMLKQQLRNEQDTRTLCGVVLDTYIVPSQLNAVVAAKAQTQAYNRLGATRVGTTVHLGVGGSGPRTHHRKGRSWERCWHRSRITWKS